MPSRLVLCSANPGEHFLNRVSVVIPEHLSTILIAVLQGRLPTRTHCKPNTYPNHYSSGLQTSNIFFYGGSNDETIPTVVSRALVAPGLTWGKPKYQKWPSELHLVYINIYVHTYHTYPFPCEGPVTSTTFFTLLQLFKPARVLV